MTSVVKYSGVKGGNKIKMFRTILIIVFVSVTAWSAEMSHSYASLEKHSAFKPDLKTVDKSIKTTETLEPEQHPVYDPEERRPKIKPIKTTEPIVKHERMLSDQSHDSDPEVNRNDNLGIPKHSSAQTVNFEIAYPDINNVSRLNRNEYPPSKSYDTYEESPSSHYVEPETTPFSLVWSQVPHSRTITSLISECMSWLFGSIFTLLLGTLLTFGVCTYTNICTINFNEVGPIHEEMRSIMAPARLEKISHTADFVKTAIDKYQQILNLDNVKAVRRKRRATFFR